MLEIPESTTIGVQADNELVGKKIKKVINATSPHSFTFYNGDPSGYAALLEGRTIISAKGHGAFVTLDMDNDVHLTVGDGTNMKYCAAGEPHPQKHQLLLILDDNSDLVFTVSMYGAIYAYKGKFENPYYVGSIEKVSPLDDAFDRAYFMNLFTGLKKSVSAKAFLATGQRIPGLGNGVVQDILFNAGVNPKRKISTLSDFEKDELFHSLKFTLESMTEKGGRDTEKDLFGNKGGYKTILSKNTYKDPCPVCGTDIVKEAFLGGTVYYCPACQKL